MKDQPMPALDFHQRYTIHESCAYLRCSRAFLYKKIKNGLPVIKDGARVYVSGAVIAAESKPPQQSAA